ncbi:hypothetical protein [Reichenbachiella sp. MALMAid0571]|uniref:hypothetical protein n=1 Tax=Reichenbachiella sp. MALMAid0571 TaxID=3143939 RepID=UPI0032DE9210
MKHLIALLIILSIASKAALASVSIMNGLSHMYNGNSGDVIQGQVVLVNTSDQSQRVKFELNEALFSCTSGRVFTEKSTHVQSSSTWFEGEVMEKVLSPREKYVYRFTIRIPEDPSLRGSYWTALMVSVEKPIREEIMNNGIGLNTKVRYAVGLLTNVNEFDEVTLDFEEVDLDTDSPKYKNELGIKIRNNGIFIEGVALVLEVYNDAGKRVAVFETDRNMVFPGVCKTYSLDISSLPAGKYECLLLADAREEFTGTNLSLQLDSSIEL